MLLILRFLLLYNRRIPRSAPSRFNFSQVQKYKKLVYGDLNAVRYKEIFGLLYRSIQYLWMHKERYKNRFTSATYITCCFIARGEHLLFATRL